MAGRAPFAGQNPGVPVMRAIFAALVSAAERLCRLGILLSSLVLIGAVLVQVSGRIPGIQPPAWTEEIARFALVYVVAFSCGVALLRGELVNVDLVTSKLPAPVARVVEKLVDLLIVAFALAIIPGAWAYVTGSLGERARTVEIPMVWVYAVALIIPVSLAFFALARLLGFARRQNDADAAAHGELV